MGILANLGKIFLQNYEARSRQQANALTDRFVKRTNTIHVTYAPNYRLHSN